MQLGKILDAVKAVDAEDGGHTLVVLTADHGATYGAELLRQDDLRRRQQQLVLRAAEPRRLGRRAPTAALDKVDLLQPVARHRGR